MSKTASNANQGLWQRIKGVFTRGASEAGDVPKAAEEAKAAAPVAPLKPETEIASAPVKSEPAAPVEAAEKVAKPAKSAKSKSAKAKTAKSGTAKSRLATASASKGKSSAKTEASSKKAASQQPDRSKAELLEEARVRDIAGRSSMTKAELERALRTN